MAEKDPDISALGQRLFSLENLYRAYRRCRRHKRNTLNALRFEQDLEENLVALHEELAAGTYRHGRAVAFRAGDGLFIPPGREHEHKARALTESVTVVLVENL